MIHYIDTGQAQSRVTGLPVNNTPFDVEAPVPHNETPDTHFAPVASTTPIAPVSPSASIAPVSAAAPAIPVASASSAPPASPVCPIAKPSSGTPAIPAAPTPVATPDFSTTTPMVPANMLAAKPVSPASPWVVHSLSEYMASPPPLAEELISGLLRRGHKMLISAPSKAGKSCLLMELAVSIAEGLPWLGFPCKSGRVLYVNLEIEEASAYARFEEIYNVMGISAPRGDCVCLVNLRGHAEPMETFTPKLIELMRAFGPFDAVILDPLYKINEGDENSASDMTKFSNQTNFDTKHNQEYA